MKSKHELNAKKYLKKEYEALQNDSIFGPTFGCTIGLREKNNYFKWQISLLGPLDSPYAGGLFFLNFDFPDNYPKDGPEVRFQNKIYHLNVDPQNGHISMPILFCWKPGTSIFDVICNIFDSFYEQNYDDFYDREMTREYKNNRKEFERKAKEWTQNFASIES